MPHAVDLQSADDEKDDELINTVLNQENPTALGNSFDYERDLEPGEKADDAVDFGDLSDDDLADDEETAQAQPLQHGQKDPDDDAVDDLGAFLHGDGQSILTDGIQFQDDGMDDLFGDNPSSPVAVKGRTGYNEDNSDDPDQSGNVTSPRGAVQEQNHADEQRNQQSLRHVSLDPKDAFLSREQQLQMELFQMSRSGQEALPAPPENQEELLASLWPKFRRNTVPRFIDLLPPKKARYVGKTIPKTPKPVNPTKLSLEIAPDQEKSFKTWPSTGKRNFEDSEQIGFVYVEQSPSPPDSTEEDVDLSLDSEHDAIGGISWRDLQVACEDWDTPSASESTASETTTRDIPRIGGDGFSTRKIDHDDNFATMEMPPAKVRAN